MVRLAAIVLEGETEVSGSILATLIERHIAGVEGYLAVAPLTLLDIDHRRILVRLTQTDGVINELVDLCRALNG